MIFLGACRLLGSKGSSWGRTIPDEVISGVVESSKKIFAKVFDTEE